MRYCDLWKRDAREPLSAQDGLCARVAKPQLVESLSNSDLATDTAVSHVEFLSSSCRIELTERLLGMNIH